MGFDPNCEEAKYLDKNWDEGGVLIMNERHKCLIRSSMKNLNCASVKKFQHMLGYQIELGCDKGITTGDGTPAFARGACSVNYLSFSTRSVFDFNFNFSLDLARSLSPPRFRHGESPRKCLRSSSSALHSDSPNPSFRPRASSDRLLRSTPHLPGEAPVQFRQMVFEDDCLKIG